MLAFYPFSCVYLYLMNGDFVYEVFLGHCIYSKHLGLRGLLTDQSGDELGYFRALPTVGHFNSNTLCTAKFILQYLYRGSLGGVGECGVWSLSL